jgi:hypothetical protein
MNIIVIKIYYFNIGARLGRQSNIFKHQIIETKRANDQIITTTKTKRKLSEHENKENDLNRNEFDYLKRIRLDNDTSLINYDNHYFSYSSSKDNSIDSNVSEESITTSAISPPNSYSYQSHYYNNTNYYNSFYYNNKNNYETQTTLYQYQPSYNSCWGTAFNSTLNNTNNNYNQYDYSALIDFNFNI